jgi:hypothetical protein
MLVPPGCILWKLTSGNYSACRSKWKCPRTCIWTGKHKRLELSGSQVYDCLGKQFWSMLRKLWRNLLHKPALEVVLHIYLLFIEKWHIVYGVHKIKFSYLDDVWVLVHLCWIILWQVYHLLGKTDPSSCWKGGPISKYINDLGMNISLVVSSSGTCNQEWLWWQRPAVIYPTDRPDRNHQGWDLLRTGAIMHGNIRENPHYWRLQLVTSMWRYID